jgi:predicted flap endonuclease-1-like 5' DNA nuclease
MAERPSVWDYNAWSTRTWTTALIAGIVALLLFWWLIGASFFVSLLIGILVFLAVIWWLQRSVGDDITPSASLHAPSSAAPRAAAPMAPAAPAAPVRATPEPVAAPAAAPAAAAAALEVGRPRGMSSPRAVGPDDLKKIKGVGPKLEELLNSFGYYHFDQIAAWTAGEAEWMDGNLEGFRGRVTRDGWVSQARILAGGGTTEFSERVEKGDVYD